MKIVPFAIVGIVSSRSDASALLVDPGTAVLVERGRPRLLLILCPCGCGEEFPINLDARAAPAWDLYIRPGKSGVTLFPSVRRRSGCRSHFIVWRNETYLFAPSDWDLDLEEHYPTDRLDSRVLDNLTDEEFTTFTEVAHQLDELPWDVLVSCRRLARRGLAREADTPDGGAFKRLSSR